MHHTPYLLGLGMQVPLSASQSTEATRLRAVLLRAASITAWNVLADRMCPTLGRRQTGAGQGGGN